jgi:hypothetical protein
MNTINKFENQIIVMFTLSKNKNEKFNHLIASVVNYDKEIDFNTLNDNIKNISNITNNLKR